MEADDGEGEDGEGGEGGEGGEDDEDTPCAVCGGVESHLDNEMLLCDGDECGKGFHQYCCAPRSLKTCRLVKCRRWRLRPPGAQGFGPGRQGSAPCTPGARQVAWPGPGRLHGS